MKLWDWLIAKSGWGGTRLAARTLLARTDSNRDPLLGHFGMKDADEAEGTALFYRARLLRDSGNPGAAETDYRRALDLLRKSAGEKRPNLLFCQDEVAWFLVCNTAHAGEGIQLLRDDVDIAKEHYGTHDRKTGTALQNLAAALSRESSGLKEAEGLARDALSIYQECLGRDSLWTKKAADTLQDIRKQLQQL